MNETQVTLTTTTVTFARVLEDNNQIEVVEWLWSGTSVDGKLDVSSVSLIAMIGGVLCRVDDLPVNPRFIGPANKFKGFIYSQVMKLGVPFRNLFKNLNLDIQ